MTSLNLKSTHKIIRNYYNALDQFDRLGVAHEGAVRSAFQSLLQGCARQFDWTLVPEHSMRVHQNRRIVVDGALMDNFRLTHGYWEAKDEDDDLPSEVVRKFERGYPRDNILFQDPHRAILWQNEQQRLDANLTEPDGTDRDARNLLFPPSAGIHGMGGGGIGVQGQGACAWAGVGGTHPW